MFSPTAVRLAESIGRVKVKDLPTNWQGPVVDAVQSMERLVRNLATLERNQY
jgi:hypothetical protein